MLNTNETQTAQSNLFAVGDQDFEREVLNSSLPVIVDFWATWCPPCRALAPVYQRLSAEYEGRLRFAELDVDEHQQVVARFSVWANPTLLVFKDGKECARVVGPHPSRLKSFIDRALAEN
jgi:thioredoxin 1